MRVGRNGTHQKGSGSLWSYRVFTTWASFATSDSPGTPGARPILPGEQGARWSLGRGGQADPTYGVGGVPGKIWPWNGSSSVPVETWK